MSLEELMNFALTGQHHLDPLLAYYRSEIDRFNDERAEWALHYEQLKDNATNRHQLQRDLTLRTNSIADLEGELNRIKAQLNKQRQAYFKGLEHSQQVKGKVEENRKRYREMIAVCKPISVERAQLQGRNSGPSQARSDLELQLINMNRAHQQKRSLLQQHTQSLKQQLDELVGEHSSRAKNCTDKYKDLLSRVAVTEAKVAHLSSEYFKLFMNNYQTERQVQEQNQIIRLKVVATGKRLRLMQEGHMKEHKGIEKEVKQKNKEFKGKYDAELKKKGEHIAILKEQNDRIKQIYEIKLKKLQKQLRETCQSEKREEERLNSESNSLRGQIKILRRRQQGQGVRQMRAQMAENEEETSEELSEGALERIGRQIEHIERRI